MQITEFLSRLSQHKRVLREIQGIWAKCSFHNCFKEHRLLPFKKSSKSSTIPVGLSESCLSHDVTVARFVIGVPSSLSMYINKTGKIPMVFILVDLQNFKSRESLVYLSFYACRLSFYDVDYLNIF